VPLSNFLKKRYINIFNMNECLHHLYLVPACIMYMPASSDVFSHLIALLLKAFFYYYYYYYFYLKFLLPSFPRDLEIAVVI